jgi:spoIIIJ-associated protein
MSAQPKEILAKLLDTLGFAATIEEHTLDGDLTLDVKTVKPDEAGRLIGRQGQTLADLQYLVNRILFQQDQQSPKVMLDVSGYRSQAREALLKRAAEAAEKVRRWGDSVELEPMGSYDRRVIHHALRDDPDVETHSVEVDGTDKKALILRHKKR